MQQFPDFRPGSLRSSLALAHNRTRTFGVAALLLTAFTGNALAQTQTRFVPFQDFLEGVRNAPANTFTNRAEAKVKEPAALEEMRQAVLERYKGVTVSHSFLLDEQHYDCVPIEQQPAFRTYGLKSAAKAPPAELLKHQLVSDGSARLARTIEQDQPFDAFGNPTRCEANTIPLLRTTLETMSNFGSLREFYQKHAGLVNRTSTPVTRQGVAPAAELGAEQDSLIQPAAVPVTHKYSFVEQDVNNLGGNTNINIWSPPVNRPHGEVFSLSQAWFVGGSGSGTQTEEVGWIVYPSMFNASEQAHFFIFSTPDNYESGCYNNTCGDFVQVAENGLLGSTFGAYSTFNGPQYEFSVEYQFFGGNWWLGKDGTWIGYYPGKKYKNGQNSRFAQEIQYGTEGVGTTLWPPEGSGGWAADGFGMAAYQRNLYYLDLSLNHVWTTLSTNEPSPACYTISGPFTSTGLWTRYFFLGGPGGSGC